MKLTPLCLSAQRLGAHFMEREGWQIPEVYTSQDAEADTAREGVALADETPNGKLTVEGRKADIVLSAAFDPPALAIGEGKAVGSVRIYRLRRDLYFIGTLPGQEMTARERITAVVGQSDRFVTVTDITHGRAEIRVVGPWAPELLSKVCGLDFHPSAFGDGEARQTSLARTTQLVIRCDIGQLVAYSIIGARSLGAYLWETLTEAGHEWGIAPIGRAALHALEEDGAGTETQVGRGTS